MFPTCIVDKFSEVPCTQYRSEGGLTLRDYFAASAMQGLLFNGGGEPLLIAENAYKMADFMLQVREVKTVEFYSPDAR